MTRSKDKGKRYELELVHKFKDYGYDARRSAQYCGNTGDAADLEGIPHIHVEAKHQEQFRIYDWMAQAVRDSKDSGRLPTVFFRKNNFETLVTMRFDDWMQLYQVYEAMMESGEQ